MLEVIDQTNQFKVQKKKVDWNSLDKSICSFDNFNSFKVAPYSFSEKWKTHVSDPKSRTLIFFKKNETKCLVWNSILRIRKNNKNYPSS